MISERDFAQIVGKTKSIVLSAVAKNLPERFHYLIDDAVQETYLRAYRALVKDKFKGESELSTWLYAIARNEALRITKKSLREEQKQKEFSKKSMERIENKDVKESDDVFAQKEAYQNYLIRLPRIQKEVVDLYLRGFTEKEIAAFLSIAGGTVKSRLSRARELISRMRNSEEK
ncbi:MAG: RNA polymerase sigma factor [Spirochaetes bacterium]|nr:RNA polymerase sigma factor [Spirochaetota bacterium]MBN2772579.1 RNA polymerase sigma factor [Spirochaetota bacterium]